MYKDSIARDTFLTILDTVHLCTPNKSPISDKKNFQLHYISKLLEMDSKEMLTRRE